MGTKIYPRLARPLTLLLGALAVMLATWWLGRHAGGVADALGAPGLAGLVKLLALVALGLAALTAAIFSFPLLQRYLRRRPTLEVREEGLVVALGLGNPQGIAWESITGVRAHHMAGPLKLTWLIVAFQGPNRLGGRDVFIPRFFLDRGVEQVVALLEPLIAQKRQQKPSEPQEPPERRRSRGRRR